MRLVKALVRKPSPKLENGLLTHMTRRGVDADLVLAQWEAYCDILRDWAEVIEVEPAPHQADSVFIEDTTVVYGDTAVIAKPRFPSRQPETVAVEQTLREQGLKIKHLADWGYLEGGDILKYEGTIWAGLSTRTDLDGLDWLKRGLSAYEPTVVTVPMQHALNLKSAVSALPDGTFIAHPKAAPPESYFPGYRRALEPQGSRVLILDGETILMSETATETAAMLKAEGFNVITTAMTELEKCEGGVTSLSIRIRE